MSAGVLDTSVFIAAESGRSLRQELLPSEGYVTVVTIAELEAGVLAAKTTDARAIRLRTLQALVDIDHLDIDRGAAHEWARLRCQLAQAQRKVNVNDLWIAAVAQSHGLPVITQDEDFDIIADASDLKVVRV